MIVIIVCTILGLIILILLWYKYHFLRDPERTIPTGKVIVSPADGKIIHIGTYHEPRGIIKKGMGRNTSAFGLIAKKGYIISIFMSPLDVHINRAPLSGKVISVNHIPGRFLPAHDERALFENEKTEIVIKGKKLSVMIILIAGIMARRIVSFVKKDQTVAKGERIGMIKMGSQATLILSDRVKIKVNIGDRVTAGESIIAYEE